MGEDTAAFYKALFTGQAEKGDPTKKAVSRRRKTTGAGPSTAKRARKATPEEAIEEPGVVVIPQPEVTAEVPPRSPTSSQALLDAVVESPSAEERRRIKGKGVPAEEVPAAEDDVVEVPSGSVCGAFFLFRVRWRPAALIQLHVLLQRSYSLRAGWPIMPKGEPFGTPSSRRGRSQMSLFGHSRRT